MRQGATAPGAQQTQVMLYELDWQDYGAHREQHDRKLRPPLDLLLVADVVSPGLSSCACCAVPGLCDMPAWHESSACGQRCMHG